MNPAYIAQWTAAAAQLDFDTLLDGRGNTATRSDVDAANTYARAMVAGLRDANGRGLSAAQLQNGASIGRFEGTPFAQVRDGDIAALYQRTRVLSLDASVAALAVRVPTDVQLVEGRGGVQHRPQPSTSGTAPSACVCANATSPFSAAVSRGSRAG